MAAAVVPIVTAFSPLIISGVTWLVKFVETKFAPKTGSTKFDTVLKMATELFNSLATAGVIPLPKEPELKALVQLIVDTLNKQGALQGGETKVDGALPGVLTSATATATPTGLDVVLTIGGMKFVYQP